MWGMCLLCYVTFWCVLLRYVFIRFMDIWWYFFLAMTLPTHMLNNKGCFDSTLLYFTLFDVTLLYFTLLYSTLLYSTLLYSTLLYSTLLYSTLSRALSAFRGRNWFSNICVCPIGSIQKATRLGWRGATVACVERLSKNSKFGRELSNPILA